MRKEIAIVGASLALLAGCAGEQGGTSNSKAENTKVVKLPPAEKTWHVGEDDWVPVAAPVTQHYSNADEKLKTGDTCVMVRGAALLLSKGKVYYSHKDALGTECPDGAVLSVSPAQATAQDKSFQTFAGRRQTVTLQVSRMSKPTGSPQPGSGDWVDLVNPKPVTQQYTNGTEQLTYGDKCIADGQVQAIGKLTTGETVMRIDNSEQIGTECPTGALYLATAH